MKYLIVGLGNIGSKYDATRHNIGFDVADAFVIKNNGQFEPNRLAEVSEVKWKGRKFVVIKPTTYMNLSGKAVKYWMDKEKVTLDRLLVIVDDLALPIDELRLRAKGSSAGHNGLKDIEEKLGTQKYPRLRFGIGNDFSKGQQIDFVLSHWEKEEMPYIKAKILKSLEIIESLSRMGLSRTMNQYNKQKVKPL